jgi:hypothetical protein
LQAVGVQGARQVFAVGVGVFGVEESVIQADFWGDGVAGGVPDLVSFGTVAVTDTAQNAIEFIVIESYTYSDGSSKWAGL